MYPKLVEQFYNRFKAITLKACLEVILMEVFLLEVFHFAVFI